HGQIARFLDQGPFNAPIGLRGTMTFNSTAPVASISVLGFVTRSGSFLMPQNPVVKIPDDGHTIIPYFIASKDAKEATQTTDVVMLNMTENSLSGTFTFYGQGTTTSDAQPVDVTIDGETASTFSYFIPPRSSRRYRMSVDSLGVVSGSMQISSA